MTERVHEGDMCERACVHVRGRVLRQHLCQSVQGSVNTGVGVSEGKQGE